MHMPSELRLLYFRPFFIHLPPPTPLHLTPYSNPHHISRWTVHITAAPFCNFLLVPATSLLLIQIIPSAPIVLFWTTLIYVLLLQSETSFQFHAKLEVKVLLYTLIFRPSNRPQKYELKTEGHQLCQCTKQRSLKHKINELDSVCRPWRGGQGHSLSGAVVVNRWGTARSGIRYTTLVHTLHST